MAEFVSRFAATRADLGTVLVAALVIYVGVIAATRIVGLRSFAKMSAFDFAMTVAIGSIIASAATGNASLAAALLAVGALFAAQYVVARLREATSRLGHVVDNAPLLLMYRGRIIDEHLHRARMTERDLTAKLREANVLHLAQVTAAVFETTGDVTVLHGAEELDPRLLEGVRCGPVDPSAPA
jgi:uncharacterized membrane protein YcaP (DUF421 family)